MKTENPTIPELDDELDPKKENYVSRESVLAEFVSESSDESEPECIKTLRQIKGIRNIKKVGDGLWEFNMS